MHSGGPRRIARRGENARRRAELALRLELGRASPKKKNPVTGVFSSRLFSLAGRPISAKRAGLRRDYTFILRRLNGTCQLRKALLGNPLGRITAYPPKWRFGARALRKRIGERFAPNDFRWDSVSVAESVTHYVADLLLGKGICRAEARRYIRNSDGTESGGSGSI